MVARSYLDLLKMEEKSDSLALYVKRNFNKWGFNYNVKVEIVSYSYGEIKVTTEDGKVVGTYSINDFKCIETYKDLKAKDVPQYWENDVAWLYKKFMNQEYKTWKKDYVKMVKSLANKEIKELKERVR